MYKGIILFDEVNDFLNKHGFFKHKRIDYKSKFASDFLYIREDKSKEEKINLIKKIYRTYK